MNRRELEISEERSLEVHLSCTGKSSDELVMKARVDLRKNRIGSIHRKKREKGECTEDVSDKEVFPMLHSRRWAEEGIENVEGGRGKKRSIVDSIGRRGIL